MIRMVIEQLTVLLPLIADTAKDKREVADNALHAIAEALTETSLYISRYTKTNERELETQEELARLWSSAAVPIRHIDKKLANICALKSKYWVDPESWDENETKGIAIDIDTVRDKYRAKLN